MVFASKIVIERWERNAYSLQASGNCICLSNTKQVCRTEAQQLRNMHVATMDVQFLPLSYSQHQHQHQVCIPPRRVGVYLCSHLAIAEPSMTHNLIARWRLASVSQSVVIFNRSKRQNVEDMATHYIPTLVLSLEGYVVQCVLQDKCAPRNRQILWNREVCSVCYPGSPPKQW